MTEQIINEFRSALAKARSQFEYLADLGIESQKTPLPYVDQSPSVALEETLDTIRADIGDCQRCGLATSRTKLVYGVGNQNARLVLVGDAPAQGNNLKGEPFAGEAGLLLDRILLAMGMQREDVYLCNVLKCQPPSNRSPLPEEVKACEVFLARQITAIRPQVIVGLGDLAMQCLLQSKTPINRLRGEWQRYQGIPLMPTYDPAYLLRNPEGKRDVWEDMKAVLHLLNAGDDGS